MNNSWEDSVRDRDPSFSECQEIEGARDDGIGFIKGK